MKVLLQVVDAPVPDERMGQKNETGQGDDGEVEENAVPKADFEAAKAAAEWNKYCGDFPEVTQQ